MFFFFVARSLFFPRFLRLGMAVAAFLHDLALKNPVQHFLGTTEDEDEQMFCTALKGNLRNLSIGRLNSFEFSELLTLPELAQPARFPVLVAQTVEMLMAPPLSQYYRVVNRNPDKNTKPRFTVMLRVTADELDALEMDEYRKRRCLDRVEYEAKPELEEDDVK